MNKYKISLDEDIKLIRLKYQNLIKDLTDKSLSKKDIAIINKNINDVMPIINVINNINQLKVIKDENTKLLDENNDEDIINLVDEENHKINIKIEEFKSNVKILITKYHTNISQKREDVIFEIRAGTGGDEASIFAFELWQMYLKFFDKMKWKHQVLSYSSTNRKSIRELILRVSGVNIYEYTKYESGVHRVQRIPVTESQGRIHTSVCTVVVLHAEIRKKMSIKENELRVDVYRASGPGGQSVNTTDSAVRMTHIPTGIVTQCQNEKSQLRNKMSALKVLEVKLQKHFDDKAKEKQSKERKTLLKSSDRSEKIRTYNFPQDRCTDHRSGVVTYNLSKLMSGDIYNFINKNILALNKKNVR